MTMQTTTIQESTTAPRGNASDPEYASFIERVQAGFESRLADGSPLFTTDVGGLWEAYLSAFPEPERQFHNCSCCRRFIETYGGLVVIAADGSTTPAIWNTDEAQGDELAAVAALERLVRKANVTGPFLSKAPIWGTPETGAWRHMSVTPPKDTLHTSLLLTPGQAMAEKREDFKNVRRALAEFTAPLVNQALALLKSDALYRSEKVLGQAQWLSDVHAALEAAPKHRRDNVLWRFVGLAPAGFCHPRSSMIGTLLADIEAGVSFEEASRKFRAKMDPLQYQRPQAVPSAGNIAAAEKTVEKLGIGPSLARRFARLEELQTVWKPTPAPEQAVPSSIFGHLVPKGAALAPSMTAPAQTMTWEKFARTVLPEARSMEAMVPTGPAGFVALLTAENFDAPPILQWDSAERRNPFSWYLYNRGSMAAQWGLVGGSWRKVNAITLNPSSWFGGFAHHEKNAVLILDGAKDSQTNQGNALFPETLKSELHGIRATIEAYSKNAKISGGAEASACGLMVIGARVRVTDRNGVASEFRIDRWE